ncbi:phage tail protein [Alkalimonas sp. NCh-2]|uniref:phage tail-collar fiber domain-containing protein n=1 Tax=Alkalimonas sp. NCh-2 TaxID=3144846 RepID=UPI0031F5F157
MASVITIAGEQLFAAKAQANEQLDIDTFIFANVPGQDPTAPIDRAESIPTEHIVHQQIVQQTGRINENVVVYSTVLDSVTGPFEFNWVGLYSSVNDKLVAVNHVPTVTKTVTDQGEAGNTLNRNFGIEYSGIAELTGITVAPETWQLDFTARLNGMDDLTRNLATDMNGKDWFIGDGFKVVPRETLNSFKVTAGTGYVSGLRIELESDHILTLNSYPKFVYIDAWFDGDSSSKWKGEKDFLITDQELVDYTDESGKKHYLCKIANIESDESVVDLRSWSKIDNIEKEVIASRVVAGIKHLKEFPQIVQHAESYIDGTGVGGGNFVYFAGVSESMHDGGNFIAAAALNMWDGSHENIATVLSYSGYGQGCFVRVNQLNEQGVDPLIFGAMRDGQTDDSLSFIAAMQSLVNTQAEKKIKLKEGKWRLKNIQVEGDIVIEGTEETEISVDFKELMDGTGFTEILFIKNGGGKFVLRNLKINGNWENQNRKATSDQNEYGNVVRINNVENVTLENIEIINVSTNWQSPANPERINYSNIGVFQCENVELNNIEVRNCIVEGVTTYLCKNVYIDGFYADTRNWSTLNVIYADYCDMKKVNIMQRGEGSRINAICTEIHAEDLNLMKDTTASTSANGIQISNENNEEEWPQSFASITNITGKNLLEVVKAAGQHSLQQIMETVVIRNLNQVSCNVGVLAGYVGNLIIEGVTPGKAEQGITSISALRMLVETGKGPKYVSVSGVKGEFQRGIYILDAYSTDQSHVIDKISIQDIDIIGNRPMYSDNNWNTAAGCSIDMLFLDNVKCKNSSTSFSLPVSIRKVNKFISMNRVHQHDYDNEWSIRLSNCDYMLNGLTASWAMNSKSLYPYHFQNGQGRVSITNGMLIGSHGNNAVVRFSDTSATDVVITGNSPDGYVNNITANL